MRRPIRRSGGTILGKANKKQKQETLTGKIARSQLVSTFGIGSLYEMRVYTRTGQWVTSVTVAGLDEWEKQLKSFEEIREPALEHVLKVGYFIEPPEAQDDDWSNVSGAASAVPVYRFPNSLVCNKCDRLGYVGKEFRQDKLGPKCADISCGGIGVPVRLVTTCYQEENIISAIDAHPGHLDDFPWHWWARSDRKDWNCGERTPQLKLVSTGRSAGLSGLRVECHNPECKKARIGRSLEGVFGKEALHGLTCNGKRPWLADNEDCRRSIRTLMRGASNVYFPVIASALSIPPNSTACRNEVGRIWRKSFKPALDSRPELADDILFLVNTARNASPLLRSSFTDEQITDAILEELGKSPSRSELPDSEQAQRALERRAIVEERTDCDDEGACLFEAERIDDDRLESEARGVAELAEHLVLVHRLREVRALRGFQRLSPEVSRDAYNVDCAPLSRERKNWLPAIKVMGEGVYIELKPELVRGWAARESVSRQFSVLENNYKTACKKRGSDPDNNPITPAFVLVHTLSHLLINQLSLDCGYSSASLRERLYIREDTHEEDWYGLLIYTSTTSSDGTLGGLVRQGRPDLFRQTIEAAITNATWCSSDPLCIESTGQGDNAQNLAACHACCIVSETSCEHRNLFLDRGLIVGTPDNPDMGFFHGHEYISD